MEPNDHNSLQSLINDFKSAKHDLNNLLNNVLNAVELLKDKTAPDSSIDCLTKQIESNTILASKILSELLLERVSHSNAKSKLDLKTLIKDTIKLVTNDNLKIELTINEGEYFISGNYIELQRVLLNLISNAKESKNNELRIVFKLQQIKNSSNENLIELSVSDNGIGIPKENINSLFDKGFSTKSNDSNCGLGLSIVKEIIEDHSGQIDVISEENIGTSFNLYFPLSSQKVNKIVSPNKRVLVAEDDDFQREVLSDLLRSMQLNVFTASNGIEALDLYYSINPDLVFLDNKMPGMSGLECIKNIRANNLTSDLILVTGSDSIDIQLNEELFKVLSKPYSFDDVKKLLAELF